MKSYIKLSHIFLSTLFILCFGSCYGQKEIEVNRKIKYADASEERRLQFTLSDGKIINRKLSDKENFSISNNGESVIITKHNFPGDNDKILEFERLTKEQKDSLIINGNSPFDTTMSAVIYNANNGKVKELKINSIGDIYLSNDLKFVLLRTYFALGDYIPSKSFIEFYDRDGKYLFRDMHDYSTRGKCCFSESGKYLSIQMDSCLSLDLEKPVVVKIFDDNYKLLFHKLFFDWPQFDQLKSEAKFDEQNKIVKIPRFHNTWKKEIKDTLIIDLKNNSFEFKKD